MKIEVKKDFWYHGSPYSNVDFDLDRITSFTKNLKVAEAYAHGTVAFTGKNLGPHLVKGPTVYKVILNLKNTFDMRKDWSIYENLRKRASKTLFRHHAVFQEDGETYPLPKLESEGFIMNSGLPSYGRTAQFKVLLNSNLLPTQWDSMFVDEGSQGFSVAVFDPRHKVTVVQKIKV